MALGTGEHTIGGEKVSVKQARRAPLGGGGLVMQGLTVDLKRGGAGRFNFPTKPSHPLKQKTTTLIRRPKLPKAARATRRASTARPVLGPIGTRPRNITP